MRTGNKFTMKSFCVDGNWFEPLRVMKNDYKSIVGGEYVDTTSSCGDWSGYIIQRCGKSYLGIPFSQENLNGCFGVDTFNVVAKTADIDGCKKLMNDYFANLN